MTVAFVESRKMFLHNESSDPMGRLATWVGLGVDYHLCRRPDLFYVCIRQEMIHVSWGPDY